MRKLKKVPDPPVSSTHDLEETSGRLAEALKQAEEEAEREEDRMRTNVARSHVFESAHAPKEILMPSPMRRIVEDHFPEHVDDLPKEHRRLEEALKKTSLPLGDEATNARDAFKLSIRFRQMRSEWEHDNRIRFASMRSTAHDELQHEKKSGKRQKQITDADVDSMCAHLFPDEWRAQEGQRNRAHLTEKSLDHLAEVWLKVLGRR